MSSSIVNCLQMFLKGNSLALARDTKNKLISEPEPVPPDVSATYFTEPSALVDCLSHFLRIAQDIEPTRIVVSLIVDCFSTILEVSLHSKPSWIHYKSLESSSVLLRQLLLENDALAVREGVAGSIRSVCGALPT